jgi:hypothetical protein
VLPGPLPQPARWREDDLESGDWRKSNTIKPPAHPPNHIALSTAGLLLSERPPYGHATVQNSRFLKTAIQMTNIELEASVEVPFNEHVIAGKALQAANGGDVGAVRQAVESPHE